MKIKIVFSRTVVTQIDQWPEFSTVEVEVPDYLKNNGQSYGEWHLVGAVVPKVEAADE